MGFMRNFIYHKILLFWRLGYLVKLFGYDVYLFHFNRDKFNTRAKQITSNIQKAGPLCIKFAQWFSQANSKIPVQFKNEFSTLQDNCSKHDLSYTLS